MDTMGTFLDISEIGLGW